MHSKEEMLQQTGRKAKRGICMKREQLKYLAFNGTYARNSEVKFSDNIPYTR
jgi:hypothetical protein